MSEKVGKRSEVNEIGHVGALSRIIGDTKWINWSLFKALLLRIARGSRRSQTFYYSFEPSPGVGHQEEVKELQIKRNIKVMVVQSWTKFFSSTGLRIGSLVCFDNNLHERIKKEQPPWSMNAIARDYSLQSTSLTYCTWKSP